EPAVRILVLDACRNNPLAQLVATHAGRAEAPRGLAAMTASTSRADKGGTIIVYSTAPNNVAYDSVGGINSPFTTAMLRNLDKPSTDIQVVLSEVEGSVKTMTNFQQQ